MQITPFSVHTSKISFWKHIRYIKITFQIVVLWLLSGYENEDANLRSSRPGVFFKTVVLRNFVKFTEKHLCQSLFFQQSCRPGLRPATVLKRDSGIGVFLWVLWNFSEHLRWLLLKFASWCKQKAFLVRLSFRYGNYLLYCNVNIALNALNM